MSAKALMVQGTMSGVGKSLLVAGLCRVLAQDGLRVAPFKSQNMALNSAVTAEGLEMGRAQAMQAQAAGVEPRVAMNPVLLKPADGHRLQVILRGEPLLDVGPDRDYDRKMVMERACESYDILAEENDFVVCEGSGSPAELNLLSTDMANVGMMRARRVPSVLVADIERGGVFAAIYGTWKLIPDEVRPLLKGFIINRFRGDASLLDSGIRKIEELTGMKCIGVVPYENLRLPEEDSLSSSGGKIGKGDIRSGFIDNLDRMLEEAEAAGVDFSMIEDMAEH